MGYGLVILLGALAIIAIIVLSVGGRSRPAGEKTRGTAPARAQPAADEPTPAASATADEPQADRAQSKTPPA